MENIKTEINKMKEFASDKKLTQIKNIKYNDKEKAIEIVFNGSSLYYEKVAVAWELLNAM